MKAHCELHMGNTCDKGEDIIILMFFLLLTSGNSDIKYIFHQEISKKEKKKMAKKKITSTPEPFLAKATTLSGNGKILLEKWLKTLANM